MADGLNRVFLIGNLGADPELRFTGNNTAVLGMRLAVNESYLDKDKVRQERVEWIDVVIFGTRAEGLSKFLTKGRQIAVEGGLMTEMWEKDGVKQYRVKVRATNIVPCGGRDERAQGSERRGYDRGPGDADRY